MSTNNYNAQIFSGNPLKSFLKRIYWNLFRRPHKQQLGENTFIAPKFSCWAPSRMKIGTRVNIGPNAQFKIIEKYFNQTFEPKLEIGNDIYIGGNCEIVCMEQVTIGDGSTLSDQIYINDSSHSMDIRQGLIMDRPLTSNGPIAIGESCFIGLGAAILSGVTLGDHCVVGAKAVVTKSAPPYSMLVGNPARIVARFDHQVGGWVD